MKSGSAEFIEQWEKKYEQQLGRSFEGGTEPSGGQWQKLALARMFYRNANVLVLDEPTSALDAEAEEQVFQQLDTLPENKTVLFIAHRFSTVRRADRIIVLQHSTIEEMGTHAVLLKKNGLYSRLFRLQAKGYHDTPKQE